MPPSEDKHQRYLRASQRKEKKKVADAVSSLLSLRKRKIDFIESELDDDSPNEFVDPDTKEVDDIDDDLDTCEPLYSDREVQTTMKSTDIEQLQSDLSARISDKQPEGFSFHHLYTFEYYENSPEKVSFYTGLPNLGALKLVFKLVEGYLPSDKQKCLPKKSAFLICMVKMRMNYLFADMANHLSVSTSTIQRCFHETLDVLFIRLKFLVKWPNREQLRTSMPMCFREKFGTRVVVVMDCFELFTERPSSAINKVYTYSNYKHHQTVKYLIGIAPQGVVTFISEGWGGRTSDKFLTEESEVLKNLLPGDIVMVDRGFCIEDSVNFYQAELAIPSFTKGKKQLHPVEVEKTRKIASVRIHVERVIGHILRKFHVFQGIIPVDFIKCKTEDEIPTIDKLVLVACALTNVWASIVPFD